MNVLDDRKYVYVITPRPSRGIIAKASSTSRNSVIVIVAVVTSSLKTMKESLLLTHLFPNQILR